MITKSVLLILGAGASMPYGFPSGGGLTNQIIGEIKDREAPFTRDVLECGFEWELISEFRKHLELSFQPSIDAFLEHRTEFMGVGKTCIARALIPCEVESKLYRGSDNQWYEYLFQKLNATPDKFDQNRLAIITFNYDRSLEQFLLIALQHSYGLSDSDTVLLVRSVPILHVHGDLGRLPMLHGTGRTYNPTVTVPLLKQCSSDIKIIYEDIATNPPFTEAHKMIQEAEIICFLGFGFHSVNLDRIFNPGSIKLNKNIYGTAYNMPSSEKEAIRHRFTDQIQLATGFTAIQALWEWPILI